MDMQVPQACFLTLLIGSFTFGAFAADVTGAWKGQLTDREGSLHDVSIDLKADGTKVTGTVVGMPPGAVLTIQNGEIIEARQKAFSDCSRKEDKGWEAFCFD